MSAQKDNGYKRNHYIAEMLSGRFTDKDGKLYCCRKENPRNIFRTTPINVFLESDLYIQYDENGKRDVSVEKGLSQFEGKANEVIEKIVSSARGGMNPGLTPDEKKIWDEFFCKQWRRLPLWCAETISDDSLYKKCLDSFENERRPLTDYERRRFDDPKRKARILKNGWVKSVELSGGELMRVLGDKGLCVAVIRNLKKSFVIGSNPIIRIAPNGHTRLDDPAVEALFSIAHDVVVSACLSRGEEKLIDENDSNHIRQINEAIWKQSDMIAGRSHELITSLSRGYHGDPSFLGKH
ncbi:MAG: DUF4238 domain-containing protein [Desulfurellaceae bacterium]|nr:DUF4238 domain-containing protein [Desulfurellaceae bacterium]